MAEAKKFDKRKLGGLKLQPLEVHLGATSHQVEFGFAIPLDECKSRLLEKIEDQRGPVSPSTLSTLVKLLRKLAEDDLIWIIINAGSLAQYKFSNATNKDIEHSLSPDEWRTLWNKITGLSGGGLNDWVTQILDVVFEICPRGYPEARIIPAKRQIGSRGEVFEDFSGAGLIDKLAELQNPGPTERALLDNFVRINSFLQEITGDRSAMIEIPHNREEVLVHKEQRVLPLSSLGTGIHEVVMIAAFCTLTKQSIVCIEEPEIHLHPLLQKKLIKYITTNTDNQYFIATHSASIIDQPGASVFHVTQKNNTTSVELLTF